MYEFRELILYRKTTKPIYTNIFFFCAPYLYWKWAIMALREFIFLVALSNVWSLTISPCSCPAIDLHHLVRYVTNSLPLSPIISCECQVRQALFPYYAFKYFRCLFLLPNVLFFRFSLKFHRCSYSAFISLPGVEDHDPPLLPIPCSTEQYLTQYYPSLFIFCHPFKQLC